MQLVGGRVSLQSLPVCQAPSAPLITGPLYFPALAASEIENKDGLIPCWFGTRSKDKVRPIFLDELSTDPVATIELYEVDEGVEIKQSAYGKSAAQFGEWYKRFGNDVPSSKLGKRSSEADALRRAIRLARGEGILIDDPDGWE